MVETIDRALAGNELAGPWSLPWFVRGLTTLVLARFDRDARLRDANAGFLMLAGVPLPPEPGWRADRVFQNPRFDDLVRRMRGDPASPVFEGVLNLGPVGANPRSLRGRVYGDGRTLFLVAERDVVELEQLTANILDLNEQLAEMQRELVRMNRALRHREAELERLMRTDSVTDLPNRRDGEERLRGELARAARAPSPLCVALGDIDHFKAINDSFGHAVGDRVLAAVAAWLRNGVRRGDGVARWGGEEFLLILPQASCEAATTILERLAAGLRETPHPDLGRPVTMSFGLTVALPGETAEAVLHRADEALYAAKRAGRDRVVSRPVAEPS